MIKLVAEPFDSGLWGKKVCKLYVTPPFPATEEVRQALDSERPDIVFAFIPFARPMIETIEELDFSLASIRSTYVLQNDRAPESQPLAEPFTIVSIADKPEITDSDLLALLTTIGSTSRYFADVRIPRADATKLYDAWIRNSLYQGYSDQVFLVMHERHAIGMITLKIRDGRGFVDLIGVLPSFQNAGLGSALMTSAVGFFREKNIAETVAITEGENVIANAFYQRRGFLLQNVELVYHKHFL